MNDMCAALAHILPVSVSAVKSVLSLHAIPMPLSSHSNGLSFPLFLLLSFSPLPFSRSTTPLHDSDGARPRFALNTS